MIARISTSLLRPAAAVICILFIAVFSAPATAQDESRDAPQYRMPPQVITDIIDAPPTPSVTVGPNKQWLLIMGRPNLPPISEVASPELRLAGLRIDPRTNGPSRERYSTSLTLKNIASGEEKPVKLPDNARVSSVNWSPDGKKIAYCLTNEDGIVLCVTDVATCKTQQLKRARLNAAFASPFRWLGDSRRLICMTVPEGRPATPEAPTVPEGPVIQENIGKKAPVRTFQDLLQNPHDEALFDHYLTAQIVIVSLGGKYDPIGEPAVYKSAAPAPGGDYLLVQRIHRPYSYLVPLYRFPYAVEIWNLDGEIVKHVADKPLADDLPQGFGAVQTGPRSFGWRADADAVLYWVEAQDGGDPRKKAEIRDMAFMLEEPFDGEPVPLISTALRFSGIQWGSGDLALASEFWFRTRQTRTWRIAPDNPGTEPELLIDRSYEDRYSDPGRPVMTRTRVGTRILMTLDGGDSLLLTGRGASPEGNRPFIDKFDLKEHGAERLWRSEAPYYEQVTSVLDEEGRKVLTRRESKTEPPNYFVRDLTDGTLTQLTFFPHPAPQLADVQKELIRYQRDDGVQLTATLYLPAGYDAEADGPLPVLMWAYPIEFKSADAAGQVRTSPYQFVRAGWSSPVLWLALGYAVLDGPTMPIIGEGEDEPNDTYVEQLTASAKAAVDELVRRGVGDRNRMAIGGHSYGAFMTGNLLAHSDLFRTGIARSGAYNRTLTPFGFQSEERTFWEAPEVYHTMSPFMHADRINEPILLIHGEADSNSGTFPMQSERFYHALKGHGATARLVMLPHESHGYRARESVMHMLWEMTEWLDRYVKSAPPKE